MAKQTEAQMLREYIQILKARCKTQSAALISIKKEITQSNKLSAESIRIGAKISQVAAELEKEASV